MLNRWPDFSRLKENTSVLNLCGIDIETTAIDDVTGDVEKIWSISWYCSDKDKPSSVFWKDGITKQHLAFLFENCGSLAIVRQAIDPQSTKLLELRNILCGETKYVPCFHNSQFDYRHLSECGIYIPYFHDTMVLCFCSVPPSMMGSMGDEDAMRFYSLKYLGELGFCDTKIEFSNEWGKFSEDMLIYNQGDAKSCTQLAMNFLPLLCQDHKTFDAYIVDLTATVMGLEMNRNGVYINTDALNNLLIEKEKETEDLLEKIYTMCPAVAIKEVTFARPRQNKIPVSVSGIYKQSQIGYHVPIGKQGSDYLYWKIEKFNPNSSKHLVVALKYHCEWQPTVFSKKTNEPTVNKAVISELSNRYVFANLMQKYRKNAKLLSTYLKPFTITDKDNRIHPSFLVCATRTSRYASRRPNFQNIPRGDIRKIITASDEDKRIVCIDLSQIELRILAWYMAMIVGDSDPQSYYLWKLYEQDADVHEANRQMMDTERKNAKIAIFLNIYGGGPSKLAQSVGIPIVEARTILSNLDKNVTALPKLKQLVEKSAERLHVLRTMYGHKIVYPKLWQSNDKREISQAKRQYFNALIQGTQADIVKILMWQVRSAMTSCGAKVLIQVHDEVVYEVPYGNVPWFCDALDKAFNNRILLKGLKMCATPGVGMTWSEAKEDGEIREKKAKEKAA